MGFEDITGRGRGRGGGVKTSSSRGFSLTSLAARRGDWLPRCL